MCRRHNRGPSSRTRKATSPNFSLGSPTCFPNILKRPHKCLGVDVTGEAQGAVVFIEVRWVWLILPLLAITLAVGFLGTTIWNTHGNKMLFKTSIWPVFSHGLDGDVQEAKEVRRVEGDEETLKAPLDAAERTRVRLERDKNDILKLKGE
ncbi:hypothetical protein CC80DRAFT_152499 [Byssothecium circinans]|uniref:Uncharacterized protein n=1 Tax=Byssothecium circinans TaxID=147558 RepID=A0A6A5TR23_9PLEO|nr:hypothetical protein CC80DRAFT_152499 [Byssothecium circinans]